MSGRQPTYDYGTCIYCGDKYQIPHWKPISYMELNLRATDKCTCEDAMIIKVGNRKINEAIKKERLQAAIPQ